MQTAALAAQAPAQAQAQTTDVDVIHCQHDSAEVRIFKGDLYPIHVTASTLDGRVVELLLSPTGADVLGRTLINKAVEALPLWRPR